ncbi:MAG: hypothetical protein A07HN63_02182 [uncultured archaeon A07HN63]|nr:MAG: hypothetical protein A07HN63_02182 [uncultured archaeon A07HN63]
MFHPVRPDRLPALIEESAESELPPSGTRIEANPLLRSTVGTAAPATAESIGSERSQQSKREPTAQPADQDGEEEAVEGADDTGETNNTGEGDGTDSSDETGEGDGTESAEREG